MSSTAQAVAASSQRRRVTDLSRSHAAPRVRSLIPAPAHTDHMRGWVAASMSRVLPDDASDEMRAGFAEGQSYFLSIKNGTEAFVQVLA